MELRWEEGYLQAGCYQAEDENREFIMEERKHNVNHLPESLPYMVNEGPT